MPGGHFVRKRCLQCEIDRKTKGGLKQTKDPVVKEAVKLQAVADAGLPADKLLAVITEPPATLAEARRRAAILQRKVSGLKDMHGISRRLTTILSMQAGADVLNREAPVIMELLAMYASDPSSPYHEFALKEFLDRIVPRKAFQALAIKEAGLEEAAGKMQPQITINVVGSVKPHGNTIDVTPTADVTDVEGAS
jgi:hypothetical protein